MGKMLAQCAYGLDVVALENFADVVLFHEVGSGKCDPDKKPSYCSKK
jgi:hypothetical protein